jgi:hypothetical protein
VLALAGCGGGGDGDAGEKTTSDTRRPALPRPRDSAEVAVRQLMAAVASGDCRRLFDTVLHSTKRPTELARRHAPPTRDECAFLRTFARETRGFRPDGPTRAYGTAALAEGHNGRTPYAVVFVLDLDGRWKTAVGSASYPQIGTRPAPGNRFDANVARFVRAARADDCREVFRLLSFDSEVHERTGSRPAAFCASLRRPPQDPRSFFVRLKADPAAKPIPLGKTAEFAFYGLALKTGVYYTLFAARQAARFPVTPAHERDAVYNWYLARE